MNISRLFFPSLANFYRKLDEPSIALLRVVAGVALITHGWSKIQDPTAMAGFLEGMGFWPGAFWSFMVSITESIGGLLLAIGLLTRPAALLNLINMSVIIWFHWIFKEEGYGGAEKAILWWVILFYFVVHGGQYYAVDKAMKREF